MRNFGCFLLTVCILTAIPAYADGDVTLFGAAQHQGKLTLQSATSAASSVDSFNPGTFGVYGARISHGKVFGSEHTIAYVPNFLGGGAKAIIYNSDVLLQAPLPKVRPYATAGLGTIFTWGSNPTGLADILFQTGTKFAINYGGGVKVLPAGPVGFRVDIRGYTVPGVKFNFTNPTTLGTVQSQSQTLNMLEVGFGVVFKF
jgi:opacity protein-like surface antigen